MGSPLYTRDNAIVPITAGENLTGKEGYFYKLNASNKAVLCDAATDVPHGLILEGAASGADIAAAPLGGNHGTVRVKLGAQVTDLRKDLTLRADGTAESDDGAGARVVVARPLETGAADEMIEAVLLSPRVYPATVTLTSTDGTAGAVTDSIPDLAAETEKIGDDVRVRSRR